MLSKRIQPPGLAAHIEAGSGSDAGLPEETFNVAIREGNIWIILSDGSRVNLSEPSAKSEPLEAAEIFSRIAKAIEAAHQQGLLHRDLKPGSVHTGETGTEGPSVEDLGLAKRPESEARYAKESARLEAIQYADKAALAAKLTPILARFVGLLPADGYADKRELAKWVNAELRRFGLSILCPKTGRPSALIADPGGKTGRFQLYNETPEGKKVRSFSSANLPPLVLIPPPLQDQVEIINNSLHIDETLTINEAGSPVSEGSPETTNTGQKPAIAELFANLPENFEGRKAALTAVNVAFHQEIINQLAPALNAHLQAADSKTADAKKQLAGEVMDLLNELGLSIKCPVTGQPSSFQTLPSTPKNPHGRFEIRPKGTHRPSVSRANIADLLPLELTETIHRRESKGEWQDRVGRQSDRTDAAGRA